MNYFTQILASLEEGAQRVQTVIYIWLIFIYHLLQVNSLHTVTAKMQIQFRFEIAFIVEFRIELNIALPIVHECK